MVGKAALLVLGLIAAAAGQSCVAPFVLLGGKCFHLELSEQGSSFNWQEARDYCKSLGGDLNADLATFPTCDQYTQFARYIALNVQTNKTIWMGARTAFTPNMWTWVTLEDLATGVPFWYNGETFAAGNECAAADTSHYSRLVADDCNVQNAFACTYTPAGSAESAPIIRPICPNGGIPIGDFCYVFHDNSESFTRAEEICRQDHEQDRGELYYPSGCDEFSNVAHHLETSEDIRSFWVGGVDISGLQEWFWVNGAPLPGGHPYWASGEPSHELGSGPREYCAAMTPANRFYLNDASCSEKNHFICKLQIF